MATTKTTVRYTRLKPETWEALGKIAADRMKATGKVVHINTLIDEGCERLIAEHTRKAARRVNGKKAARQ